MRQGKTPSNLTLGLDGQNKTSTTIFQKISYSHIFREHNKSVDLLSKLALQEKMGIITYHH
jgi:hypothetical protein